MTEKIDAKEAKGTAETPKAKNEFVGFMRRTFVNALDHYAARVTARSEVTDKKSKPVRKIAEHWLRLDEAEKLSFFDKVIGVAEVAIAATPVALATLREARKAKKEKKNKKAKAAKASSPSQKSGTEKKAAKKKPARKKKAAVATSE